MQSFRRSNHILKLRITPSYLRKINRLLIRSANWIGDAVMTTPAMGAIRKNFPGAEISILAKPWVAPLFENSSHTDHVLIYDGAERHRGFAGKFRLARDLKSHSFDAAILFQNAFEAAFVTWLADIPLRIGYNTDVRTPLLTHAVLCIPEMKKVHQVRYYMGILRGIGLQADDPGLCLRVSPEDRHQAGEILGGYGISHGNVIGINPGATFGTAKRWPRECYAELCRRLQKSLAAHILVFGGPEEKNLGHQICDGVGQHCTSLCGKTTLREAVALIERCHLFVTNDSGLMHIAAALNVPQIAIFGPTNHVTTAPASPESRIVRVPVPCSPCLKPECPEGHHRCMKAVTVDMVWSEVCAQLEINWQSNF